MEEQPVDEADRLVHAADQLARQAHEGDDLADRGAVVQMQPGAEREDRDQGDGRAGARQHREQRPPVEHRELHGDQLVHGGAQLARLGREPHEALHQHDVAERIARLLGKRGVVGLDPGLGSMRVAEHRPGQAGDHDDEQDEQGAEPPVQEQRQRQQHEQGDEGREVLAQERQPHAEQGVGALPHDLQLAARMRAAVEGVRQPQDVLEILGHRGQAPTLRQAVGVQRDQDAGADAADPDQAPCAEQQQDLLPGLVARALAAAGERVDDAAEQERPEEAGRGERRIGQAQRDRKASLRSEQGQHAAVQAQETHLQNERSVPISIVRFARFPQASCVPRAQPKLTQTP